MTDLLTVLGSQHARNKWQCPAHGMTGEHALALSVSRGDDGRALIYCHGGCDYYDVLRALHLPGGPLLVAPPTPPARHARAFLRSVRFPPPRAGTGGSPQSRGYRFESQHPYGDDVWLIRLRHPSGDKAITWESLNPKGERVPGLLGRHTRDLPLYRERDLRMAIGADEPILLVESESSVDALRGYYGTTWAGGAGSPPIDRLRAVLGGYPRLVVIPDHDDAGLGCLATLRAAGLAEHILMPELGEDARDLLARVGPTAFRLLVNGATP